MNELNNPPVASTPLPPESHRVRFVVFILSIILVLVAAGIVLLILIKKQSVATKKPTAISMQVALAKQKAHILSLAKTSFLPIETKTPVSKTELPKELQKIIPAGATALEAYKLTYQGNKSGFLMRFDLKGSLFYNDPILSSAIVAAGFKGTNFARGDELGFFEFKNNTELARFIFSSKSQNTTNVQFQSVSI